jgi:hypothetical protein
LGALQATFNYQCDRLYAAIMLSSSLPIALFWVVPVERKVIRHRGARPKVCRARQSQEAVLGLRPPGLAQLEGELGYGGIFSFANIIAMQMNGKLRPNPSLEGSDCCRHATAHLRNI